MRITERILAFTLLGSEWVLWLLIFLSIVSVAVMVERAISLRGRSADLEGLSKTLLGLLGRGDVSGAREALGEPRSPEARVALVGIDELSRGRNAAHEAMASARSRERLSMEKYLGVPGTLGNNAPFIGLFGTVLGIVRSFRDLAANISEASSAVMAGIAEALIATAVGLLVAIPAVIAYNVFKARVKDAVTDCQMLARILLAQLKSVDSSGRAAAE